MRGWGKGEDVTADSLLCEGPCMIYPYSDIGKQKTNHVFSSRTETKICLTNTFGRPYPVLKSSTGLNGSISNR
ncbi:hypothetical protein VTI74DRAFT_7625 [Chaetomium olivicolor]